MPQRVPSATPARTHGWLAVTDVTVPVTMPPALPTQAPEPFVGQFEHSLDSKGRIVLPAVFRGHFDAAGFLTKSSEGCLALVTPERFRVVAGEMIQRAAAGNGRSRAAKRAFAAGAARVSVDKQGRFAIPEELRRFAHLERDCVVVGALDEVEIWDATRWQSVITTGEAMLTSPEGA